MKKSYPKGIHIRKPCGQRLWKFHGRADRLCLERAPVRHFLDPLEVEVGRF